MRFKYSQHARKTRASRKSMQSMDLFTQRLGLLNTGGHHSNDPRSHAEGSLTAGRPERPRR
jgi:hypothetical protein